MWQTVRQWLFFFSVFSFHHFCTHIHLVGAVTLAYEWRMYTSYKIYLVQYNLWSVSYTHLDVYKRQSMFLAVIT